MLTKAQGLRGAPAQKVRMRDSDGTCHGSTVILVCKERFVWAV